MIEYQLETSCEAEYLHQVEQQYKKQTKTRLHRLLFQKSNKKLKRKINRIRESIDLQQNNQ